MKIVLWLLATVVISASCVEYYGKYIGPLSRLNHGVSGEVYAVDARTLHIRDFTYDGEGPAAYFYAGDTKAPGSGGFRVRDEQGSSGVLKRYNKNHITLTLPEGKTLNNIRWFSVWCDEFAVNFGDVRIPRGVDYPKPQKIGPLSGVHGVSSENIVVVDAQTLLVPSFSYDGEAPDAKFWVGQGPKPSPQGIRVPDENGKQNPLRRYDRKTIVLTLPGELTVFDIGHFGVWCEAFTVDFGHVVIPQTLNVPPSLKMLGVSPQKRSLQLSSSGNELSQDKKISYENVLPLFNLEGIRPTTYRPDPHRFSRPALAATSSPPRPELPPVQILPSISVPAQRFPPQPAIQFFRRQMTEPPHFFQPARLAFERTYTFQESQRPQYRGAPLFNSLLQLQQPPPVQRPYRQQFARPFFVQTAPQLQSGSSFHGLLFDPGQNHFQRPADLLLSVEDSSIAQPTARQLRILDSPTRPVPARVLNVILFEESNSEKVESKLNCEVLDKHLSFEVRWAVAGDSVVIQLVAKLEDGEYMSFGVSGSDERSVMIGGDVVVAWVDKRTLNGYAEDYYLDAKSQCAGTSGSCPDNSLMANSDSVRLLNAALVNGYSIVTYQRPLAPHDLLDRAIWTNGSQPIIWAIGPINSKNQVSYHSITSKGDVFMDFGRPPKWNCPIPEGDTWSGSNKKQVDTPARPTPNTEIATTPARVEQPKTPPPPAPVPRRDDVWEIPPIQCNEPEDGVFYAQMGPTGGKRGYSAITGHVGWGISYYINGLLIPEINVVRGHTYTFVVEGGSDHEVPAQYHPFYITDDPVGGFLHKTPEEKRKTRIFAGVEYSKNGDLMPTGVGRLCTWTPDPEEPPADEFSSFGAYQRTLTLICDRGEPGVITWTPDRDTPDTVYYQCFVHRYLGWKINVLDECDVGGEPAASEPIPSRVKPRPEHAQELISRPSIRVTTRVKPDLPPSQSIISQNSLSTKSSFPYEIITTRGDNSTGKDVIPVTEDVDEGPVEEGSDNETSTVANKPAQEAAHSNTTMVDQATALPLIHRPYNKMNPPRNGGGFRRPGRPQHRPYHVQQQQRPHVVVMATPPKQQQFVLNQRPHPIQSSAPSQNRPIVVKKPLMRIPQRPQNTISRHPPPTLVLTNRMPPKPQYVHKFKKPVPHIASLEMMEKNRNKMHPSQMIGHSSGEGLPAFPPAVNTGFNPGSLVIESGFRPILQNRTVTAQDRISDYIEEEEDNVEGVINMAEEAAPSAESQTEMFEPVFVPSPLDSRKQTKKPSMGEPGKKRRIVVRRPVYKKKEFDETAMANEKRETFRPAPMGSHKRIKSEKRPVVLAYDGKEVAGVVPPPGAGAERTRPGGSALLTQSPQFGPFRGEVPPPITGGVLNGDIPQLRMAAKVRPITPALLEAHHLDEIAQASEQKPQVEEVPEVTKQATDGRDERRKRSADHVAGHHDHDQHEHNHHDHSQHDHHQPGPNKTSPNNAGISLLPTTSAGLFISVCLLYAL